MAGDNGSSFNPDAFAKAMKPLFDGLSDRFSSKLTEQIGQLRTELGEQMVQLRTELGERIVQLRTDVVGRIDRLIDNQGEHYRGLEQRVDRLEKAVFPPKAS